MKRHASMNRTYRLVWSQVTHTWVAVAENARGHGKSISGRKLMAVLMALLSPLAQAVPVGGQVVSGTGSIAQSGATTTINQTSQNLSLSWQSFNTAPTETVNFVQPSAAAIAVNRIYDTNGTQFLGHLNANGQVYLINPNGILFGAGSQVNVGGLVASTLDINDASLNSATRSFSGNGNGSVVNQGTINGGYVAFIGNTVSNQGTIVANGGTVALGAGNAVTLTFAGNSLVHMQVDQNTLNNLAKNGGLIRADGGMVLLTAGAKNALLASVVNNTGVIEARSVQNVNGTIVLDGGNLGAASNSGTLDASGLGAGETGGTVKVLGGTIDLLAGSNINVSGDAGGGTALVGGNFQGKGPEQNAATATVAANTAINADAVTNGNGGKVVVWSDSHTSFDGSISARGGAAGGNGGSVETSGKKLDIGNNTRVTTLSPLGTAGNWLLDPVDFTIGVGGNITAATLITDLGLGSVTIQTGATMTCTGVACGAGTAGNGDIKLLPNEVVNWAGANSLTLSAYRNIDIGDGATFDASAGTTGNINLYADNTGTGIGTVTYGATNLGFVSVNTGAINIRYNPVNFTAAIPTVYGASNNAGTVNVFKLLNINNASGAVNNKTYDGTTTATLGTAFSLLSSPDNVTVGQRVSLSAAGATATFADKNVANGKTVTLSGYTLTGADAALYYLNGQPANKTANITSASITVSGITAGNKVYDATTAATVNTAGAVLTGKIGADVVTVSATGTFANKNVANGKTVTLSSTYSGADAGNYTFTDQASTTANITPANLTVTGITANNKTYDATVAATLAGTATVAALGSDVVSVGGAGSGTFADKNVGNGKAVTVTGYTISGTDAGNYTLVQPTGVTANIAPKSLTVSGVTANNKTYDGTTTATLQGPAVLEAALGTDVVTLGGLASGAFADKNVGNGKTVTVSGFALSGADAGNYTVVQPTGVTANIIPRTLTLLATAVNKTYDATTTATLSPGSAWLNGSLVAGETVTLNGTGTGAFLDKNVGNGKAVTLSGFSLGGADAGNYTMVQGGVSANIFQKSLTVSGVTANNKTYDTSVAATLSGTATVAALGSDVVSVGGTGSGTFATKTVGNGKAVTVTGYTISGTDAGNYWVIQPTGLTANITPANLLVTGVVANSKTYDGTNSATLVGLASVVAYGTDAVTVGGTGSGTFADKNVGNAKAVTVTGYTLGGADAGNYAIVQPGSTANITPAAITVSGISASNKTYDATTAATVNTAGAVYTGKIGADVVTVSATGTFADKNVANGKTVTLTSTHGGADAGNYTFTDQASTTANITPAAITVSGITASNKTYDATTAATVNTAGAVLTGKMGADVVTVSATGTFADKNVANGKTVTLTSTHGGADAGNYTFTDQASTTANITPANLAVTGVTAANKTYDATIAATLGGTATVTALGTDVVTLGGTGSGTFANKNVGSGKAVTVTGYTLGGTDAGNYTVVQPTGVTANITPANLAVTGVTAANKVYDATTTATLSGTASIAVLGTDVVSLGGLASGAFADKNVGTGKAVTVTGYTISGADAGNYALGQPAGLTANITPAALSISGITASDKTHDGTTAATISTAGAVYTGKLGADAVSVSATGTFADPNVGNGKTVTLTSTYGGADAGNYTITDQASTTANITSVSVPAAPPQPAQNAIAQVQASVLPPQASIQPQALSLSPSITVEQSSGAVSVSKDETTSGAGSSALVNTTLNIGGMGATLHIVNGGMKLPENMVHVND
ncbi:YDG domain-containing protein [Ferrigenium kumadai]|nr:YDG domain-containing protein [Ferrigenium kumadai]